MLRGPSALRAYILIPESPIDTYLFSNSTLLVFGFALETFFMGGLKEQFLI